MATNEDAFSEMQEFVIINADTSSFLGPSTSRAITPRNTFLKSEHKWTHSETKILIDLYGKFKSKIGTFEIKNIKMLWEKIANEFAKFKINVTPSNCLNRWKVLERNYKKFVDNQNKTGRGRKYFEYEAEMSEIFGKKKNINPEILLSTETIDTLTEDVQEISPKKSDEEDEEKQTQKKIKPAVKVQIVKKKITVMEKIRLDRKEYNKAKLEIEQQKIAEIKKRNVLIEKRNLLIQERNEILREKKDCNCCSLKMT